MKLDEIQTIFNNAITDSPWWNRFKGSEFVRYLVTFVAMVVERISFASERRLQESFLTRAVSPSSVLAGAESRGYIPMKRKPNKKRIVLTNKTASAIVVPALTRLYCPDNGLFYLMENQAVVPASGAVVSSCIQAELSVLNYRLQSASPYASVLLDADTSDKVAELRVFVTGPVGLREEWTRTKLFRGTDKNSRAFVEFYTPGEQIGIRFGNGVSGRIPAAQSLVQIECLLTNGPTDVPAGMAMMAPTWPELTDVVDIVTGETLQIGTERESTESIRQNALYYPSYDEQIVWGSDHLYYIRTNIAGLNWISVWGEADQENIAGFQSIDFINQIYISANHPVLSPSEVKAAIELLYQQQESYNENYQWVFPLHRPFTIALKGKTLSTNTPENVIAAIKSALKPLTASAVDAIGAPTPDEIWNLVQSTGLLQQFDIQVSGLDLMVAPKKNEFRYLDLDTSIFQIS